MKGNRSEARKTRAFLQRRERESKGFRALVKKEAVTSALAAEHEAELIAASTESIRAMKNVPLRTVADGEPHLYGRIRRFLEENENAFSEARLKKTLFSDGTEYGDEELGLLPAFLTAASAEIYLQTRQSACLKTILTVSRMDFSDIFFAFSGIERIFLSEAAGVYRNCSTATRYLYHRRLADYAKKRGLDPIPTARRIVAKANEKNTHIGEVLPKERRGGVQYFAFLCLMSLALLSVLALTAEAGAWTFLLVAVGVIPVVSFADIWVSPFFVGTGEKYLPSISRGAELEQTRVMVSIATFLYGEEKDKTIFDKLEDFYLTNGADNISFAVLGDLPQSNRRRMEADEATFAYAKTRIKALREKYGEHFYLFIRERRRSASEGAYI
jgi:hypothetical protein